MKGKRVSILSVIIIIIIMMTDCLHAEQVVIGEKTTITSKVLTEQRILWIHVPMSYQHSNNNYPVLYLLDGARYFYQASAITDLLAQNLEVPEMIVVGVDNTDRSLNMSHQLTDPTIIKQFKDNNYSQIGGADEFIHFFKQDLIPYIDKKYRTQSYNILVGDSFGGLFSVYTLLSQPDIFDAYIAISPYLHWDNNSLSKNAPSLFLTNQSSFKQKRHLFMSIGSENEAYKTQVDFLASILKKNAPENLEWRYQHFADERHVVSFIPALHHGLKEIFKPWAKLTEKIIPDDLFLAEEFSEIIKKKGVDSFVKHVEQSYQKLSSIYSAKLAIPARVFCKLGDVYAKQDDSENALKMYQQSVLQNTGLPYGYNCLAKAYEKSGELQMAKQNYLQAIKLSSSPSHATNYAYKLKLSALQNKMDVTTKKNSD